ncbi:subtilisin-like proteinase Spm1 [Colletotrichum spaethianum]|uniref:Subtilisin-like proteinase Spm1 n=1 Tax=Colletotrichum spaethianum TaxID=700344 RepID=A0AA37L9S9_9PEZI|nr:subtilisin-like proteinase Spm1 [Colletotrichum spaethianum]GKT44492.1 subtilisin-like proteinase Spm1 [Colletotrichum spaethianum]
MVVLAKLACALCTSLVALVEPGIAAPYTQAEQNLTVIQGKWILEWVNTAHKRSLGLRQTTGIERTFGMDSFHAYTGEFDEEVVADIEVKHEVISIEPDHEVSLTVLTEIGNQPWGLASISPRTRFHSDVIEHQTYIYDTSAGTDTFAYGRAIKGYNFWPESGFEDEFGLGTHVAGIIGLLSFGVANNATIVDVKTNDLAYGTTAKVIEAIKWSVQNITNTPGRAGRSFINMILGKFPIFEL